jgi:WD40 repeat protein
MNHNHHQSQHHHMEHDVEDAELGVLPNQQHPPHDLHHHHHHQQQQQQQQPKDTSSFYLRNSTPNQSNQYPTRNKPVTPMKVIDLKNRNVLPAEDFMGLSKPAVSSTGRHFLVGTTNMKNEQAMMNRLVFGIMKDDFYSNSHNNNNNNNGDEDDQGVTLCTYAVNEHVRDLHWLHSDERRIVVALNNHLGMVLLNEELTSIENIVLFPNFHTDTIRQLAPNPTNQALVLSGGFDGKVFVTNVSRLVDDNGPSMGDKKSENSVYLCGEVVGSVQWHPSDSFVASATTDNGVLHVFDIRTDQTKPAFVYGTEKMELFSHTYYDDFTVCLAYGDGSIQIHDIRHGKGLVNFKDHSQVCIGDIAFDSAHKKLAVFGVPSFSTWQFNDDMSIEFNGSHTHMINNQIMGNGSDHWLGEHQVGGTFVPNSNRVLCSDSLGNLSMYDLD